MPKNESILFKVLCPGKTHKGYTKILFAVEMKNNRPDRFFLNCGTEQCRKWYMATFNRHGGLVLTEISKTCHLNFHVMPTMVNQYKASADA